MLEKFEIHSQLEKKNSLQRLCDQFLSTPCFEGRDTGKVMQFFSLHSLKCLIKPSPKLQLQDTLFKIPLPGEISSVFKMQRCNYCSLNCIAV